MVLFPTHDGQGTITHITVGGHSSDFSVLDGWFVETKKTLEFSQMVEPSGDAIFTASMPMLNLVKGSPAGSADFP